MKVNSDLWYFRIGEAKEIPQTVKHAIVNMQRTFLIFMLKIIHGREECALKASYANTRVFKFAKVHF